MKASRLEAFSDGVLAIIITIGAGIEGAAGDRTGGIEADAAPFVELRA